MSALGEPEVPGIVMLEVGKIGQATAFVTKDAEVLSVLSSFPRSVEASPYLSVGYRQEDGRIEASLGVSLVNVPTSRDSGQVEFLTRFASADIDVDGPRTRIASADDAKSLC